MTFTKVLLIRVTFTVPKVIFYSSRNTDIPVKNNNKQNKNLWLNCKIVIHYLYLSKSNKVLALKCTQSYSSIGHFCTKLTEAHIISRTAVPECTTKIVDC